VIGYCQVELPVVNHAILGLQIHAAQVDRDAARLKLMLDQLSEALFSGSY
jgi:hypothetical protein